MYDCNCVGVGVGVAASPELVYKVQRYHLERCGAEPVSLVAHSLLLGRWDRLVRGAAPAAWRSVLAALLTHADSENLSHYCGNSLLRIRIALQICVS